MFFSMAATSSPAGSGKSHITAAIASILGLSESHSQCIISAPSTIACDNIEERISNVAQVLVGSVSVARVRPRTSKGNTDLPSKKPGCWEQLSQGGPQLRIPMSVRGFALHQEPGKLMSLLRGHPVKVDDELDPSPWKFHHSLCWWTARALGFELEGVERLDVDRENEDLGKLYVKLQGLADAGPSFLTDDDGPDNSDSEVKIKMKKTFEKFTALV
ncbi:hypothetical protein FMEXI_5501 [Fusarium mexicanum]|uniref:Uncharacterized protein n=1 Tax=Fusarium mexicanum TaxID=751941 RepID=A0A8H5J0V9_9HYPO|nr:hypothetical protein FMEXI_5501 [Fusarium mexicanum]